MFLYGGERTAYIYSQANQNTQSRSSQKVDHNWSPSLEEVFGKQIAYLDD